MKTYPIVKRSLSDDVKKALKEYIYSQNSTTDEKLPPETKLAEMFGVSRVTIRRVLDDLEQEGIVLRKQGKGTFINRVAVQINVPLIPGIEFRRIVERSGYEAKVRIVCVEEKEASSEVRQTLQLQNGESVVRLETIYYADQHPAIYCIDILPRKLFAQVPTLEQWGAESFFDILKSQCNIIVNRGQIEIEAVGIHKMKEDTEHFGLMKNDVLLRTSGLLYNQENQPIDCGITYYDTNRIRYNLIRGYESY